MTSPKTGSSSWAPSRKSKTLPALSPMKRYARWPLMAVRLDLILQPGRASSLAANRNQTTPLPRCGEAKPDNHTLWLAHPPVLCEAAGSVPGSRSPGCGSAACIFRGAWGGQATDRCLHRCSWWRARVLYVHTVVEACQIWELCSSAGRHGGICAGKSSPKRNRLDQPLLGLEESQKCGGGYGSRS